MMTEKARKLVRNHKQYNFPDFISLYRKAIGYSRITISEHLEISYERLMRMETGRSITIYLYEIVKLAKFYEINSSILIKKCVDYNKDNRKQNCLLTNPRESQIFINWEGSVICEATCER